eukprot:CAMPEP_0181200666 /NCGR_PEP_ID=MMETSP1096-20121128/17892_1 /TAXON_ID=156174 ORGANISM="Chrysochromulina ericina, Strain CCMP281" /NCGR_SAMPLE_ID=MMETSP1096 /ASSEMBLY_ACC=CAM_ASM_000453 /LENGTH=30 /DNA_ID= /DNA_START= /DNA_END= /DNA_ORIENTATION=
MCSKEAISASRRGQMVHLWLQRRNWTKRIA